MEKFKVKKKIAIGKTYDEVFCLFVNILKDNTNGWEIAKTLKKLYEMAVLAENSRIPKSLYVAVLQGKEYDNIYSHDDVDLLLRLINENEIDDYTFYKVTFSADAFLEEIELDKVSVSRKILKTLLSYQEINKDVLTNEEIVDLNEQIEFMQTLCDE